MISEDSHFDQGEGPFDAETETAPSRLFDALGGLAFAQPAFEQNETGLQIVRNVRQPQRSIETKLTISKFRSFADRVSA